MNPYYKKTLEYKYNFKVFLYKIYKNGKNFNILFLILLRKE